MWLTLNVIPTLGFATCRDDQLNAELYSKRAEASFFLGKNVLIFFRTGLTSECIPGLT